jgi:hypothetical protein
VFNLSLRKNNLNFFSEEMQNMRYFPHVSHEECSIVGAKYFNTALPGFSYSLLKDVNSN